MCAALTLCKTRKVTCTGSRECGAGGRRWSRQSSTALVGRENDAGTVLATPLEPELERMAYALPPGVHLLAHPVEIDRMCHDGGPFVRGYHDDTPLEQGDYYNN